MSRSSDDRETELKLLVEDAAALDRVLETLGGARRTLRQTNVYFDGPHGEWARAGLAVRLRSENDGHLMTIKSRGHRQGEFVVRGEWECGLDPSEAQRLAADPKALTAAVFSLLSQRGAPIAPELRSVLLVEAGSMENLRRQAQLTIRDEGDVNALVLTVECDTSLYPSGETVHEIELEIPDASRAESASRALRQVLDRAGVRWNPSSSSKRARLERVKQGLPARDADE